MKENTQNNYIQTIPFVNKDIDVPMIEAQIGGNTHRVIIDTGAEMTLFDSSLKDFLEPVEHKPYVLNTFNGGQSVVCEAAKGLFWMFEGTSKGCYVELEGDITDFKNIKEQYGGMTVIIGVDTLQKLNAKVDFENKCLVINDLSGK